MARVLKARWYSFLRSLDREQVGSFKITYYLFIIAGGLYLLFAADGVPDPIAASMGHPYYEVWLLFNIGCPTVTLLGRWVMSVAAEKGQGEANSAIGGAWMRLFGDMGVWGAIIIYTVCVITSGWWGQPLYAVFYVMMGVPGGFMFTLRSWRRLRQIGHRERLLPS